MMLLKQIILDFKYCTSDRQSLDPEMIKQLLFIIKLRQIELNSVIAPIVCARI